ncbi:hypothetical protein KKG48_04400 [Patescibacteria group bacterium]|nr:hypothetical protein [Patescibacteria group bacterium]MBU4480651.1 hypothetical protein [Patescibacteria group bacterium]MCG2821289.1 hypothetical protein [Candidatus Atribacteria bacterium]
MREIKIFFNKPQKFEPKNIKPLMGITGLYFLLLENIEIQYPFKKSRLIYIGMSEKRTNSMGKRLTDHYEGQSGNEGIVNYRKVDQINFTHLNFEMLKKLWRHRIEDLESYFILDFVKNYGVYPICNNKTGYEVLKSDLDVDIKIDWQYFGKRGEGHGE